VANVTTTLTLGPVLYHWPAATLRDFYARIADEAPLDFVCVGEIVCSKRWPFQEDDFNEIVERLERGGKTVIVSALIMPTLDRERRHLSQLGKVDARLFEANDVAALPMLSGRPHAVGPYVNVYNEGTLAHLVRNGATRICLPPELPMTSVQVLAQQALGAAIEVFAFGRVPLAISARCYHARIHGLSKDSCQFVCGQDPDGRKVATLDGEAFLAVNGVQTLSYTYTNAITDVGDLVAAGVSGLRLSPHTADMVAVASAFRDTLDGRREGAEAASVLQKIMPEAVFANGFLHGIEGAKRAPAAHASPGVAVKA
jgi:collagenase-like PrtC family protease